MLSFTGNKSIWLACFRVDFRKGFDGLLGEAFSAGLDPFAGDVVVFISRRRSAVKIVACDDSGIWILAKRLTTTRVAVSFLDVRKCRKLSATELAMFLDGCSYHLLKRPQIWPVDKPG